jgi:hypothetical protein
MIEYINFNNKVLAIVIRTQFQKEGIEFFTPNEFSQQLAYMKREKGYVIKPHVHNLIKRDVNVTQEVLLIKSGIVRVDFYNENKVYLESRELYKGDVILLASGGHGFKMIENSEIIEVKQGPYVQDLDKERFESVLEEDLNIL